MKQKAIIGLLITGLVLLACVNAEADNWKRMHSVPFYNPSLPPTFTDEESYPYGRPKKGRYGERRAVITEDEAQTILKDYFKNKVRIGKIKKREFYFEAEIRDKRGNLIDRVIIDRRTGRMRSMY